MEGCAGILAPAPTWLCIACEWRNKGSVDCELGTVPHRESICDDLDGAVIEALHSRDVEVAESCVHGDTCTGFPAHPRSCLFQWYPSASQHPRPGTGRSVVAKWVKIATAPTSSFGKG